MNTKNKRNVFKVALLVLAIIIGIIISVAGIFYLTYSTHSKSIINFQKIADNGALYYGEYTGNYYNPIISLPYRVVRGSGCSAFITRNENEEVITARNYDLPHIGADGQPTGLNIVLKLSPKGKYKSINVADAAWFGLIGFKYYAGALDDENTTRLPLALLPYACMDGLNEKGLSVSILALDTKKDEKPVYQKEQGKKDVIISQLLRYMLDECATVDEAVQLTNKYNMINMLNHDYHLFVTDASGISAVFEWRNNEFIVTYTDAATNFIVSSDDAEDVYTKDGKLKETFTKTDNVIRQYRYGYGHGYVRFNTVVENLYKYTTDEKTYETHMTNTQAMDVLSQVAQQYDGTSATSFTQYSVIYNNSNTTAELCLMSDYNKTYSFSVN